MGGGRGRSQRRCDRCDRCRHGERPFGFDRVIYVCYSNYACASRILVSSKKKRKRRWPRFSDRLQVFPSSEGYRGLEQVKERGGGLSESPSSG